MSRPAMGMAQAGVERGFLQRGVFWLLPLLLMLLLSACAPQSYLVLLDSLDGRPGAVVVHSDKGEARIDQSGAALALDARGPRAVEVKAEQVARDFSATTAAQPLQPSNFVLHFETGGARLTAESEALLDEILATVQRYPAPDISVTGHTDTAGHAEANEVLGLERARFVADWLRAAGIEAIALEVSSHGERNLRIPTADGVDEPRNRRVEVTVR